MIRKRLGVHSLSLLIFFIYLDFSIQKRSIPSSCSSKKRVGPINLSLPLPFEEFEPDVQFSEKKTPYIATISKNSGSLMFEGNFGSISIDTYEIIIINQIHFKKPSENQVDGNSFPLEIQYVANSSNGKRLLVLSKLFELIDTKDAKKRNLPLKNGALFQLGIGTGKFSSMNPYHTFICKNPGESTLQKLFGDSAAFINYEGDFTEGKCLKTQWYISMETSKISKRQLDDLPSRIEDPEVHSIFYPQKIKDDLRISQNFNKKSKEELVPRDKNQYPNSIKKAAKSPTEEEEQTKQKKKEPVKEKAKVVPTLKAVIPTREKSHDYPSIPKSNKFSFDEGKFINHRAEFVLQNIPFEDKKNIVYVPRNIIWPWEAHKSYLSKHKVKLVIPLKKHLPKIKQKNMHWRTIYFYKKSRNQYQDIKGYMHYIPYIGLVPDDFQPPKKNPVMAVPVYCFNRRKIVVIHFRQNNKKSRIQQRKYKRVCLKYASDYDFKYTGKPSVSQCLLWTDSKVESIAGEPDESSDDQKSKGSKQPQSRNHRGRKAISILKGLTNILALGS